MNGLFFFEIGLRLRRLGALVTDACKKIFYVGG